jgi:hypothetical protein
LLLKRREIFSEDLPVARAAQRAQMLRALTPNGFRDHRILTPLGPSNAIT